MFEHGWFRVMVASLLFGAYSSTDLVSKLFGWKQRPPRVRRPMWSHLLGFFATLTFYGLAGSGHAWAGGDINRVGVGLCFVAMLVRFSTRGRHRHGVHPDLAARLLFYGSLPLVVGSPKAWLWFTLPQVVIAAVEATRRDVVLRGRTSP